jgi:hypothetical protein
MLGDESLQQLSYFFAPLATAHQSDGLSRRIVGSVPAVDMRLLKF